MTIVRIALANLRIPSTPDESVNLATAAIAEAGRCGAKLVCFPECYVPGYRWPGSNLPAPNEAGGFQAGPLTFGIGAVSRTTGVPKVLESRRFEPREA